MRLDPEDAKKVRRFSDELGTVRIGAPSGLQALARELRLWFDFERFLVYAPCFAGDHLELDLVGADGFRGGEINAFASMFASAPFRFGYYDPLRPEPWQRNRVWRMSDLERRLGPPSEALQTLHRRMGVDQMDQLRSVLCEGRTLLAWFGGLAHREFTARDKARLAALIPAARRRLCLDRHIAQGAINETALAVALEAIPGPALLVSSGGRVLQANTAARMLLETDRVGTTALLLASLRERKRSATTPTGVVRLTRLEIQSAREHWLAVFSTVTPDPATRRATAKRRWPLTNRQLDVLELLARGLSNRAISISLGCAEGTAELHVSAVLARMGAESRSEAAAKFWTEL